MIIKFPFWPSFEKYKSMGLFWGGGGSRYKYQIANSAVVERPFAVTLENICSCCFVKTWRYCFSIGNFYSTVRTFIFGWCVPSTYFVLFKSVLLKSFSNKNCFWLRTQIPTNWFCNLNYLQMNQSFLLLTKHD